MLLTKISIAAVMIVAGAWCNSIVGCTSSSNSKIKLSEDLAFYLAWRSDLSCSDCREVEYINLLGKRMRIFSESNPSLIIPRHDVLSVLIVERQETGQKSAAVVPRDPVVPSLRALTNKAAAASAPEIAVMLGELLIDVISVDVFREMHEGALVFAFTEGEKFDAFLQKTTSTDALATEVTDEDVWRACMEAAQGDENLIRHCKKPRRMSPEPSSGIEGQRRIENGER